MHSVYDEAGHRRTEGNLKPSPPPGGFGSDPLSFKMPRSLVACRLHTGNSDTHDHRTARLPSDTYTYQWTGPVRPIPYATSDEVI